MNVTGAGNVGAAPVESKFDLGAKLVKQADDADKEIANIVASAAESGKTQPAKAPTEAGVGNKVDISI